MIGTCTCFTNWSDDAIARCRHRLEETMVIIRWIAVLFCFLALLLVPPPLTLLGILVTAGLAIGNLVMMACLQRAYRPHCYLIISGISSALEWLAALGMILSWSTMAFTPLPAALIILLVIDGVRYGFAGVVGAWIAAALGVGGVTVLQITTWQVLHPTVGIALLVRWETLIAVAAVAIGMLLWEGQRWLRQEASQWEEARVTIRRLQEEKRCWEAERFALRCLQTGLSYRESELLALLAREDLTYERIAAVLSVSPETVRTHVHRLGRKLGTSGRGPIVAAALERGLLPQGPLKF